MRIWIKRTIAVETQDLRLILSRTRADGKIFIRPSIRGGSKCGGSPTYGTEQAMIECIDRAGKERINASQLSMAHLALLLLDAELDR